MKKIVAAILAVLVFAGVFFCGCGKKDDGTAHFSILADSLEKSELNNLDAFAKEHGFISATYDKRKNVVNITLDETDHAKLIQEMGTNVIRYVFGLVGSKGYKYIKRIDRHGSIETAGTAADFRDITVFVNRKGFEKAKNSADLSSYIGNMCLLYLQYTEVPDKDKNCVVTICDNETSEIISQETYNYLDN